MALPLADIFDSVSNAIEFIFEPQAGQQAAANEVGGLDQVWELMWPQIWISALALALAVAIALPIGVYFGHRGRGELLAVAIGNAGRAIPELVLIAFMVAFIGVGVRQVDRDAVEAARVMGMTELEVIRRVEVPLSVPTIMSGVRTSAITIISTATIASLAGISTLGDFIINRGVYGDTGVLAGAILVALLALTAEVLLAGLQRLLTPRGLSLQREAARVTA
jgi:osmoprotectant transport system permease protein